MNLNRMTKIYERGGREELIKAVEEFSRTTKAEMLAATSVSFRRAEVGRLQSEAAEASNAEDVCY